MNISKATGNFVGNPVTKVWFTVKSAISQTDQEALIFKELTTSNVPGVGVIIDDGNVSGVAQVRVELVNTDTAKLSDERKAYPFDLQVQTSNGGATKPYTPWLGFVRIKNERTKATT